MPLVIQFTGPYAAPKILCDHCGEEITEAKDGNYQWTHQDGCADGQTALGWGLAVGPAVGCRGADRSGGCCIRRP